MQDLQTPYRALCDEYGLDPEDGSTSANEDAGAYLDPEDTDYVLAPFVLVTHAGEWTYLNCFETMDAAVASAFDNVGDSIYAEHPSQIVDIATGARYAPDFNKCPWKLLTPA
jgi:hypothetical protein